MFTVDSATISANVTGGVATATLTGLSVGTHTVTATYTSTNGFAPASTSATTFTVSQAPATVTLSNLSQTYTSSPLSATAATTPAGLAVTLTYNGSTTAPTAAGSYAVIATINNPNYSGSASGTLTIAKATTTITFSANPTNPTLGQPDLLSAAVTGVGQPGGAVVFGSGATTLCTATLNASGIGSCSFVPSTDGNLTVTAQYQGDGNHLATSASTTLFVYDAAVKLQLSSTQLVYPGATNVTVCISPATSATATGTVQVHRRNDSAYDAERTRRRLCLLVHFAWPERGNTPADGRLFRRPEQPIRALGSDHGYCQSSSGDSGCFLLECVLCLRRELSMHGQPKF